MEKQYGKLAPYGVELAPNGIELEDGTWVIPPTEEMLIERGYKEVEYTDPPEPKENYVYNPSWKETKTKIKQEWTEEYIEPEYTVEERVAVLEEMLMEMMEE